MWKKLKPESYLCGNAYIDSPVARNVLDFGVIPAVDDFIEEKFDEINHFEVIEDQFILQKMKILVGGAGGFIAGYLVKDLLAQGHEVIAADIKPADMWYQTFDGAENHPDCDLGEKHHCYNLTVGA